MGHLITRSGIQTNPEKVDAVLKRCEPRNVKQLISFLQTVSWYRKFIPDFSDVAKPLTDLTKKNKKWIWQQPQQQAFNKLKELLTTAPILQQTDPHKPYILRTDASNYALGAVLLQGEGVN